MNATYPTELQSGMLPLMHATYLASFFTLTLTLTHAAYLAYFLFPLSLNCTGTMDSSPLRRMQTIKTSHSPVPWVYLASFPCFCSHLHGRHTGQQPIAQDENKAATHLSHGSFRRTTCADSSPFCRLKRSWCGRNLRGRTADIWAQGPAQRECGMAAVAAV